VLFFFFFFFFVRNVGEERASIKSYLILGLYAYVKSECSSALVVISQGGIFLPLPLVLIFLITLSQMTPQAV